MQQHLVQATYWHDPLDEEKYRRDSTFLADINNEREVNRTYIKNLQRLEKYRLTYYTGATLTIPQIPTQAHSRQVQQRHDRPAP